MKWTGNSLRLRHLHLQGWENDYDDYVQHCVTQANVSDNCGCSVFKMKQIKCLC